MVSSSKKLAMEAAALESCIESTPVHGIDLHKQNSRMKRDVLFLQFGVRRYWTIHQTMPLDLSLRGYSSLSFAEMVV
jgi:hypothetical protein